MPIETREALDPVIAALVDGVELTEKDFLSRLTRFSVRKIDAEGARIRDRLSAQQAEIERQLARNLPVILEIPGEVDAAIGLGGVPCSGRRSCEAGRSGLQEAFQPSEFHGAERNALEILIVLDALHGAAKLQ